jgi:hypothetical protein
MFVVIGFGLELHDGVPSMASFAISGKSASLICALDAKSRSAAGLWVAEAGLKR